MAVSSKAQQFQEDMIRCRGIEFARLGMMVDVNGDMGTIQGMNGSANLDVLFTNQLIYGKAKELGVKRSADFLAGEYSGRVRAGNRRGLATRFQKSHS